MESAFTRDQLLANISLYWFTGAIGSSFFPYYFRMHRPWPIPEGGTIAVPTGYSEFPHEILRAPRSLAERTYTDIRRWTVMQRGGHFAAMEQPEALAAEVQRVLPAAALTVDRPSGACHCGYRAQLRILDRFGHPRRKQRLRA